MFDRDRTRSRRSWRLHRLPVLERRRLDVPEVPRGDEHVGGVHRPGPLLPMIAPRRRTQGMRSSRTFQHRAMRPSDLSIRAASARARSASNQWKACAATTVSTRAGGHRDGLGGRGRDLEVGVAEPQVLQHLVERVRGEHVVPELEEPVGELPGPGAQLDHRGRQAPGHPGDGLERVRRPGAVVGVGDVRERPGGIRRSGGSGGVVHCGESTPRRGGDLTPSPLPERGTGRWSGPDFASV